MRDILNDMSDKSEQEKNPMRDVQKQTALPKRFYTDVSVVEEADQFVIQLDGKSVNTPAKNSLSLTDKLIADQVALEWKQQEKSIDPAKMPLTRMINTAIDGVNDNTEAVFDEIVSFSGTDMLFYRAASPAKLVELQSKAWDPIIQWARSSLGAPFVITEGIMHVEQPPEAIEAYSKALKRHTSAFVLTGLHSATTLTGSALLGLSLAEGIVSAEEAWAAAHVDEDWNISQWGTDDEAEKRRLFRWADMRAACLLLNCK
ncbi:ATP12 family chaperone protein [Lentilitoribacter sp. EG35]|uniref:ATP12 family chaperone protein n=1 Tax=Lentilitoribacter sp. EG35 TaxID=3234192 RepID=UPI0034600392